MQISNISFHEDVKQLTGVVTLVRHHTQDKRGISSIFLLKIAREKIVVKAEFGTITSIPQTGEIWRVTGDYFFDKEYGSQFIVDEAIKQHPSADISTDVLCDFLIYNAHFVGINSYWTKKLKVAFGEDLIAVLQSYSAKKLSNCKKLKISPVMAQNLCDGWAKAVGETELNLFFERHNLPVEYVETTRQLLGHDASSLIKKNPYLLYPITSVNAAKRTWKSLDKKLRANFDINLNDKRRAISFIESILYSSFSNNGDMALPANEVKAELNEAGIVFDLNEIEKSAFQTLCFNKQNNTIQILGHQAIEKAINTLLHKRLSMTKQLFDTNSLAFDETLSILDHNNVVLNPLQLQALGNAFNQPVSFIVGEAGTGKSLLSQIIIDICLNNGINVWKVNSVVCNGDALLPNLKGESINRFISQAKKRNLKGALSGALILIENSNSVDMLTLYKLLKVIPLNAHICFIGDKFKLPPIGPGSFFKQAVELKDEALTELIEVKGAESQSDIQRLYSSLIGGAASSVFDAIPAFDVSEEQSLSIYHTEDKYHEMLSTITTNIWFELASMLSDVPKIICSNPQLCDDINSQVQRIRFDRKKVAKLEIGESVFYAGEPIIFAKPNKFIDVSVGTLANIVEVYEKPVVAYGRDCWMKIEIGGDCIDLSIEDIESIALCYAITAHKVQGNQFNHSLVILDNFYLIDKSWLYTCINASKESMLFIGKRSQLINTVDATEFSAKRHCGVPLKLEVSDE
ncbi:ATP-dependent DNA helicase [Thalassotalea piscium]|uniref:Exodeoxyribonuclease V alpha subunit n=1 Tax=Thalassotalea piscium TaxID=1230533 RepID=A0A7X0NE12_9GAMM|nr:ATP-dependent RecD-like DNA helicase [Thalassotalea piscium]MBB6541707.1 exodeoxyribonuclease V alpha subunit [Thalassotalea piscium]